MKLFFKALLPALINVMEVVIAIDDPYAPVCASNKVKDMNVKLFDLISGVN